MTCVYFQTPYKIIDITVIFAFNIIIVAGTMMQ